MSQQDELYKEVAETYANALGRLSRAYEAEADKRADLLQDIHLQLWRSFASFDNRCSLRTWIYRVAHNVGTDHVIRQRKLRQSLVGIEEIEAMPAPAPADNRHSLDRLAMLIRKLKPLDRQIIVLYLEDTDAASIAEITGLTPANVSMKVHRIKAILTRWFHQGGPQ